VLTWREAALESQAVAAAESGFGFELIRRTLPYEIGAETEIALTADGLRCDIAFCPQRDAC
jgi:two-component sensor histidine kinase